MYSHNLKRLLENAPESFYWMGFIAADGNFSKTERLRISLAIKDKKHLSCFAKYISFSNCKKYYSGKVYSLAIQDKETIPKIKNKFDLKVRKTFHPPFSLDWLKRDKLVAFFIGFADGDGCIAIQSGRKDCCLHIKIHRSWIKILRFMVERICGYAKVDSPKVKINKQGYVAVHLCNLILLRFLKKKALELRLPVLKRKWDKINENSVSRYETAKVNRFKVLKLKKKGLRQIDIEKKLNLSKGYVSCIVHGRKNYRRRRVQ